MGDGTGASARLQVKRIDFRCQCRFTLRQKTAHISKINLAKLYLILHARQTKVRDADFAISCEPAETQKTG